MDRYKRFNIKPLFRNSSFQKILMSIVTFLILFYICSLCIIPTKYSLKVGDISPADIKSPKDFVDEIATQNKINKAILEVSDQYYKDTNIERKAVSSVKDYFEKAIIIKKLNKLPIKNRIEKLKSATDIIVSNEDYAMTLKLNDSEINFLSIFLTKNLTKILERNIKDGSEDDIKKAQDDLTFYIRNSTMSKSMRENGTNIGITLIKPNLFFDKVRTQELKDQVRKQTEPIVMKKNQNIVLKGEVLTTEDIYRMRQVGLLKQEGLLDFQMYLGAALLIILMQIIIILWLKRFRKDIYNDNSKLLLICLTLCIGTILPAGMSKISDYLIPTGFIVILMTMIFDPRVAFGISIPALLVLTCITNFSVEVIMISVIGIISGVVFTHNVSQRNNIILGGVFIGLINGFIIFSIGLINSNDILQNFINSSIGLAGGIMSAILAIGVLPFYEQLFNIITPTRLMELANPNQPLLKKMLFEAPGTYHHSILVGNLSEAAASEIGANPLLARVGAYYHDIGKIKRPYFFKENQITNDNPHDKITPKLSTIIITSHVSDGIELAVENRLPEAVKNIIATHHGTTLVQYFYAKAKDEENDNEKVNEENYRYKGTKPTSKEAAIVMLADSVEAAVRSLGNPSITDLENMIEKIVKGKLKDNQLDNCSLTLNDIQLIKLSFMNVLCGIFHSRIEYPDIN